MTVSIANLTSQWTDNSITFTGLGLNVNATGYAVGSYIINYKLNGTIRYTLDPTGNVYVDGTHTVNSAARVNGSLVVANTITTNTMTVTTLTASTLNVTAISANSISGNAANSLGIVVSEIVLTTANASPYTPPANLLYAIVHVTAGGGGGGGVQGGDTSMADGGGGGGGGGTAIRTYSYAEMGTSCAFSIGIGGAGGASGATGTSGGNTTFTPSGTVTSILKADGGLGGDGSTTTSSSGTSNGGRGGSSSNGSININGQAGVTGFGVSDIVVSGIGGSSYYGGGASGVSRRNLAGATSGIAAVTFGAGGSGGVGYNSISAGNGGAGANGVIRIIEFKRQG